MAYPSAACNLCGERRRAIVGPLRMCHTCDNLEAPRALATWTSHMDNDHGPADRSAHSCNGCAKP